MHTRVLEFLAILLLMPLPVNAGESLASINIETERVAKSIYMLSARGGNIGAVVGDDGIFLIDDQYAPLTPRIRAALESLANGKGKPVRFVLNTHFHGDHTGGNENLGKAGAVIVAHDNARARMTTEQFREAFLAGGGSKLDDALPVVTFNDRVTFHLNGHTLETQHYPHAHTDGDSVVWFRENNVLHTGDIYFQLGYPFIEIARGGSVQGVIDAVDELLAQADDQTVIIPGHGKLSDKAGLREYRDMIATLRDRVAREITAGKTLERIQAMNLAKDYDARWSWQFINSERFIETLFKDLSSLRAHEHH